jgi:hypothetical protein
MKSLLALLLLSIGVAHAAPLADFTFKSPAFNGSGYSSHVLTIKNQEATRRKALEDKIQAAIDKKIADDKNTNLSKFLSNLESRIYAQISQNVATAMFANGKCTANSSADDCTGTINFQDNIISWKKVTDLTLGDSIELSVMGKYDTTPTVITVPLNSFVMPTN